MPTQKQMTLHDALKAATHEHLHGDKRLAEQLYQQILKFEKRYVPALVQLGFLRHENGLNLDALAYASRAASFDPAFLKTYHLAILAMIKLKPLKDSRSWCEKGLARHPNDATLLYHMATIEYFAENNKAKAVELCRQALKAQPGYKVAQDLLDAASDAKRSAA